MQLNILSGGAAHGLVDALAPQFEAETGCRLVGTFGAVGVMRDKLVGGAAADLLILTQALIGELAQAGHVAMGSAVDIGIVRTSLAVRTGDPAPPIGNTVALREALLAADAIYFPDPKQATAGVHFAGVIDRLGIASAVATRLHPHPNGATAMRALADAPSRRPIGCTQATEILGTPGVMLIGPLPREHELATVYTAAVGTRAARPTEARRLAGLLAGEAARSLRDRLGFEAL
jgi:molybdate transport system substrate-binding protein